MPTQFCIRTVELPSVILPKRLIKFESATDGS